MTYTDAPIPPSSQPKPKLRREATTGGYTVTVCGVLIGLVRQRSRRYNLKTAFTTFWWEARDARGWFDDKFRTRAQAVDALLAGR